MKNSKLISILKTFSKKDWKAFTKWSRSCYEPGSTGEMMIKIISKEVNLSLINSNSDLIDLLSTHQEITISNRSIANALSLLSENLDVFLIVSEVKNNALLSNFILLESYAKRGLSTLYMTSKTKLVSSKNTLWTNFFNIKTEYNAYFKNFHSNYDESKVGLISLKNNVVKFYNDISDFIILEMENRTIVIDEDWEDDIAILKTKYKVKTEYTVVFQKIIEMRKDKDEFAYVYLRNLVMEDAINDEDVIEVLMVHITSYLNLRFKSGAYELADDVLAFYEIGVKNGYYLSDGKMSPRRFLNIVNTACSLEKQDWAKVFTKEYEHLLESKRKKDIILLCNAAIIFADGDFSSVSNMLNINRFKEFDLEYRARLLKLQTNVELEKDNMEYIIDEIRTFKYYIKRNMARMNDATLKGTKTLFFYIERLISGKIDHIKEDLAKENYVMLGKWLNKTIDEKLRIK